MTCDLAKPGLERTRKFRPRLASASKPQEDAGSGRCFPAPSACKIEVIQWSKPRPRGLGRHGIVEVEGAS